MTEGHQRLIAHRFKQSTLSGRKQRQLDSPPETRDDASFPYPAIIRISCIDCDRGHIHLLPKTIREESDGLEVLRSA
jgi:hypothetical protein